MMASACNQDAPTHAAAVEFTRQNGRKADKGIGQGQKRRRKALVQFGP